MSVLRKLTALLICMVVLCGCFISCVNPNPDGNSGQGDEAPLQSDRYVVTVRIKYATNDDKMKAAVDAMGAPGATLTVNGDDLKLVTNANLDDISASNEYTYVGGVLYHATTVAVADKSVSSYEKAAMSADERDRLISKAGTGAAIGIGDFLTQERNTVGDLTVYTCDSVTDEARESLCNIFAARFDGLGAIVRIDSASYQLEMKDGRNHSSILSCNFIVTMDGTDYEITMHLYYDYDYDAEISISAPQDVDGYTEVSVDEIIG